MKYSILILFLAFLGFKTQAQTNIKYWLTLTDKNNNEFTVDNPSEFLSQRAIDRRNRYNIEITTEDLPVSPIYIQQIKDLGLEVLHPSKWFNAVAVKVPITQLNLIEQALALPFVNDTVKLAYTTSKKTQIDKFVEIETENIDVISNRIYGDALNQIAMCNGQHLHFNGFDGTGMHIAVMDAGFGEVDKLDVFSHLYDNNLLLGTYDFVDLDENVYHGSSHGTNVLSIMTGHYQYQFKGTCPNAHYWLFKTEDVNSEQRIEEVNWAVAAEKADSAGVDVINTSLGYSNFDFPEFSYSYDDMDGNTTIITRAADIAANKGMMIVNSAGNSGNSAWQYITAPADGDNVLTIGAVNQDSNYASFSSQGPTFDGRIKPDVCGVGQGTILLNTNGEVEGGNGTSFSSPLIAGLVASFWQATQQFTNQQVMQAIRESASRANNPNHTLGYGIPNFVEAYQNLTGQNLIMLENAETINAIDNENNPFNANYYFSETNNSISIELYSTNGQLVKSEEKAVKAYQYFNINLSDLKGKITPGMYILKAQNGDQSHVRRILIP